ncbi:hypothetical protein BKA69DRAFT_1078401 [Paraphysoderma sedebokerense]|nr:hypothetical protein BKA69DRAFT_1078401 [Paraphysoderma sedebokerense]
MLKPLRNAVSGNKRRLIDTQNGFDLDLSYITEKLVAMGFPSENVEGFYRNPLSEVLRFLEKRHKDHYRVYNLCSERAYDPAKFHGRVATFPFDDHNAPPFTIIEPFCRDVEQWLGQSPENVAVVHCKAGKGRTGVMLCAYMIYAGIQEKLEDCLKYYGQVRTFDGEGVTIPSQIRYIGYFYRYLKEKLSYYEKPMHLTTITLRSFPKILKEQGTALSFNAFCKEKKLVARVIQIKYDREKDLLQLTFPPMHLEGDVKIQFFVKETFKKEKLFHFWFNTFFVSEHSLHLEKSEIDKAHKDKHCRVFDDAFTVSLTFASSASAPELSLTTNTSTNQLPSSVPISTSVSVARSGSKKNTEEKAGSIVFTKEKVSSNDSKALKNSKSLDNLKKKFYIWRTTSSNSNIPIVTVTPPASNTTTSERPKNANSSHASSNMTTGITAATTPNAQVSTSATSLPDVVEAVINRSRSNSGASASADKINSNGSMAANSTTNVSSQQGSTETQLSTNETSSSQTQLQSSESQQSSQTNTPSIVTFTTSSTPGSQLSSPSIVLVPPSNSAIPPSSSSEQAAPSSPTSGSSPNLAGNPSQPTSQNRNVQVTVAVNSSFDELRYSTDDDYEADEDEDFDYDDDDEESRCCPRPVAMGGNATVAMIERKLAGTELKEELEEENIDSKEPRDERDKDRGMGNVPT